MAKQLYPDAELTGLDPDVRALQRGIEKARRAGVSARFDHGFAARLPYTDASFDVVFSSLMFHHLHAPEREAMLKEVLRVLKPGASLHLVDFATPASGSRRILPRVLRFESRTSTGNATGLVAMLRDAGFSDGSEVDHDTLLLQDIVFYVGSKAAF
jgi:ubiquinone/menaquinone biosynthesis C-methylase UbiE